MTENECAWVREIWRPFAKECGALVDWLCIYGPMEPEVVRKARPFLSAGDWGDLGETGESHEPCLCEAVRLADRSHGQLEIALERRHGIWRAEVMALLMPVRSLDLDATAHLMSVRAKACRLTTDNEDETYYELRW